uniref:Mesoderm posterior bb n=1 Tax=Erpetoichthys calabaricus TaxID=27687 RepID=A0A8C4TCK9_ERPCA
MDVTAPQLSYSSPYHWSYPNSDSELYSLSSPGTISPVSPQDVSFSSHMQACRGSTETHSRRTETFTSPSSSEEGRTSLSKLKTIRSKNTSKQRQTASEKEKLRMRDLTKALHHLRTYLPPSMAPAGQNLTKIETLRLTIRYISYLSKLKTSKLAQQECAL